MEPVCLATVVYGGKSNRTYQIWTEIHPTESKIWISYTNYARYEDGEPLKGITYKGPYNKVRPRLATYLIKAICARLLSGWKEVHVDAKEEVRALLLPDTNIRKDG